MVDLLPTEEQEGVQLALREFLRDAYPLRHGEASAPSIKQLCDLGWLGVGLPSQIGGSGLGLAQEAMAFCEFGRFLLPPTVFGGVVAAHVALAANKPDLASRCLAGEIDVALALHNPGRHGRDGFLLIDGKNGGLALVLDEDRLVLTGIQDVQERQRVASLDGAVVLEQVQIPETSQSKLAQSERLWPHVQTLAAAYLSGLAEGACDLSVDYCLVREQFGRLIGGFQAIKHKCADSRMRWEVARYQTVYAALALEAVIDDAPMQAASALVVADDAAFKNARTAIQVHGGMGFTDECSAHLYLKRAHLFSRLTGGKARQLDRMAALQD